MPKRSYWPLGILGGAAVIRILYLALYAGRIPFYTSPVVDAKIYDLWARSIAQGDWLSRGEGVFYRAPLYPYLLALVYRVLGGPVPWVPLLQLVLGLALILLGGILARRAAGKAAGASAMLLLALYGPLIATESKLLSTTLGLCLQLVLLYLALRLAERFSKGRALLTGLLLGCLALIRPQALLFAAVLPLVVGLTPGLGGPAGGGAGEEARRGAARILRAGRRWAPFWLGLALVVLPVTARNRLVGGDWVLISSNGGMTFFQGNNEENHSGLLTIIRKFELFGSATQQRLMETRAAEKEVGRSLKPSETSAFWTRQALSFILHRPLDWLLLEARKVYRIVTSYEYADNYSYYVERERLWVLRLTFVPFGLLLALGILGLATGAWRTLPGRLAACAAGLGLLGCLSFYVSARYRMEAAPGLAVLGGIGLAHALRWRSLNRSRGLKLASAALVLAASFLPAGLPARSQESITYLQLGNALEMQDRFREAERAYRQAVEEMPGNVYAWNTLVLLVSRLDGPQAADSLLQTAPEPGVADHPLTLYTRGYLLIKLGREDEAATSLEAAIQANPLMKEPHYHLALIFEKRREYEKALAELISAQALDPRDADLLRHLAYVRIQLRRYSEAREACREVLRISPGDADATLNLAVASFYLGDLDEAGRALEEVLSGSETKADPVALYYRGLVRLRRGERTEAARDLARALQANETNLRTLYYLSLARAGGVGIEQRWPAWSDPWREILGPDFAAARPLLAAYLDARSVSPWGKMTEAQSALLDRLEAEPSGAALAARIRRMAADEVAAPEAADEEGGGGSS